MGILPSRHFDVRMTSYKRFFVDFGGVRLNLKNFILISCANFPRGAEFAALPQVR